MFLNVQRAKFVYIMSANLKPNFSKTYNTLFKKIFQRKGIDKIMFTTLCN